MRALLLCLALCASCGDDDGGSTDHGVMVEDLAGHDLAGACSAGCNGGGPGCPAMCTGCKTGELCCAWSGGACLFDEDAGTCVGNGGYSCATPTVKGECPSQCYP